MHQIKEIGRVNENEYIKARIRRIRYLFILIGFLLVMLITATYAWFATQRDVSLNNLKGSIEVVESLEISVDAKNWSQRIDLSEIN